MGCSDIHWCPIIPFALRSSFHFLYRKLYQRRLYVNCFRGGDFYILHAEDSIRITELEEAVQLPILSQDIQQILKKIEFLVSFYGRILNLHYRNLSIASINREERIMWEQLQLCYSKSFKLKKKF